MLTKGQKGILGHFLGQHPWPKDLGHLHMLTQAKEKVEGHVKEKVTFACLRTANRNNTSPAKLAVVPPSSPVSPHQGRLLAAPVALCWVQHAVDLASVAARVALAQKASTSSARRLTGRHTILLEARWAEEAQRLCVPATEAHDEEQGSRPRPEGSSGVTPQHAHACVCVGASPGLPCRNVYGTDCAARCSCCVMI